MKKIVEHTGVAVLLAVCLLPVFTRAAQDTTAGNTGITYQCQNGECDFNDLILATKKVVDFGTTFALEFSVVVLAYAGFKYMQSGDKPAERTEANKMLTKVVVGIVVILAAWLAVHLITTSLLQGGYSNIIPQ